MFSPIGIETIIFNTEGPTVAYALRMLGREKLSVLSRYEVSLERSLYRALHELQRLQALRDGHPQHSGQRRWRLERRARRQWRQLFVLAQPLDPHAQSDAAEEADRQQD